MSSTHHGDNNSADQPLVGTHIRQTLRDLGLNRPTQNDQPSPRPNQEEPLFGMHVRETIADLREAWQDAKRQATGQKKR